MQSGIKKTGPSGPVLSACGQLIDEAANLLYLLVFEAQIQLQSLEVNRVFQVEANIIDKIGEVGIEVLVNGITTLDDAAL